MNIFREFDAILSALTKEQYRPYMKAYYSEDHKDTQQTITKICALIDALETKDEAIDLMDEICKIPTLQRKQTLLTFSFFKKNPLEVVKKGLKKFVLDNIEPKTSPYLLNKDRIAIPVSISTTDDDFGSEHQDACIFFDMCAYLYFKYLGENSKNESTCEANLKEAKAVLAKYDQECNFRMSTKSFSRNSVITSLRKNINF